MQAFALRGRLKSRIQSVRGPYCTDLATLSTSNDELVRLKRNRVHREKGELEFSVCLVLLSLYQFCALMFDGPVPKIHPEQNN